MAAGAPRLYVDAALTPASELILPERVAHHLTRVLRRGVGDEIRLFDGLGTEVSAHIARSERKQVAVHIDALLTPVAESSLTVHLGQAISKGDRMDYAIQKAVELGVAAITPLYTEHGDVALKGERAAKKLAHWQGVAISACEQCGRATVPVIAPAMKLAEWLAMRDEPVRWMLHPGEARLESTTTIARAALLIGPEGGLSEADMAGARTHGFAPLSLGPRILRTETAPVVALSLLQYLHGDLSR
ncbi:16S rRNA (uracil(1498)-N(3))-methyltransferase [Kushneria phosphatilytica]|uniref:16S rRNA (uracil(1498)-N(3))-methyltransferase n=1 Tax=Kushneria phosphatilytica TaxID=657387 RepID=UPI0008D96413|nr:16S rRNA (uracil(1498)-N(3))-methyltransferase [Kushneria phosphatilytica]OHV08947.1 16S rRNA (uracil(1498)-N(3))-methyltransferase [Kushneria phosphatilytica]